jgi:hypothetical protein
MITLIKETLFGVRVKGEPVTKPNIDDCTIVGTHTISISNWMNEFRVSIMYNKNTDRYFALNNHINFSEINK